MNKSLYSIFNHWNEKGGIYLYSDPHFGDQDMKDGFGYPSDEEQVKLINKKIGKYDTLVILGDIGDPVYVSELRGNKVLITGNHDLGACHYENYFSEIYTGPLFIGPRLLLSHEKIDLQFALNIHGHDHAGNNESINTLNVAANLIDFQPVALNWIVKRGWLANIPTIHRLATDTAIARKASK